MDADNAAAYEGYIGRWSRVVANDFVDWLDMPPHATWLDVGCGTGALTAAVLSRSKPRRIDAMDVRAERVAHARRTIADPRAVFSVADGTAIAAADGIYDAVVSGLLFPAIRDTAAALAEFTRVAKPGGTVAAYLWDFHGEMQLLRGFWKAAADLEPGVGENADDERFAICGPAALIAAWRSAGLSAVTARAVDARARFADFADLWSPFLHGDSPAQRYVQTLGESRRNQLREHLCATLPHDGDGSIELLTRAWAVRGLRPIALFA